MPGVPCEHLGNWDQEWLPDRSHACLQRKLRKDKISVELFRNVSVHKFYSLKALITLEQVNATEWSNKFYPLKALITLE